MIRRMSFFAILFALLLEQARPLARGNPVHAGLRAWARWVSRNFDAGEQHHGWLAWVVGRVVLPIAGRHWRVLGCWCWAMGWPLAVLWSVAVLYVTLGFRQFSHHFTDIRDALEAGDEGAARELLAQWQQVDASELPRSEIVRHVIEHSVLAAHRHVFGVLAWFSVLAAFGLGPAGAVLYRMSEFVARYWNVPEQHPTMPVSAALQGAAARGLDGDRLAAGAHHRAGFAVVGSFEEAIDSWRNHAQRFPDDNDGVILAATVGRRERAPRGRGAQAGGPIGLGDGPEVARVDGASDQAAIHARTPARDRAPAQRRGPGVAVGGDVDGAAGAADAGQAAGLTPTRVRTSTGSTRRVDRYIFCSVLCPIHLDLRPIRPQISRHSPVRAGGCSCRTCSGCAWAAMSGMQAANCTGVDVVQAELLEPWRVDQCGGVDRRPPSTAWCWWWCACLIRAPATFRRSAPVPLAPAD